MDKQHHIKCLKELLPEGRRLYGMRREKPGNRPKVSLFVIDNDRIINVSGHASAVIGFRFDDKIGAVTGFNPGYSPLLYLAEMIQSHLGYKKTNPTEVLS